MLIILFLKNIFKLYYSSTLVLTDCLKLGGNLYSKDFESSKYDGFIGFFDWLRKSESEIIGIRLCYFEHHMYNNLLHELPYINITYEGKWIEILFENETYDYDLSGDQDFTNNYVYESATGEYLFTFGLDHLTERELSSLLAYCEIINEDALRCN